METTTTEKKSILSLIEDKIEVSSNVMNDIWSTFGRIQSHLETHYESEDEKQLATPVPANITRFHKISDSIEDRNEALRKFRDALKEFETKL